MNKKRADNVRLPDAAELKNILQTEVFFPVAKGKAAVHYPDFETIITLFQKIGCPTDIFTDDSLDIHAAIAWAHELLDQAVEKLLTPGVAKTCLPELHAAYSYLAEEDAPQKSDLIFVFGSKTPLRAEKALEVYKQGLARQILVSGGNPIYAQDGAEPEAEIYKRLLVAGGVPAEAIVLEPTAISMADNVRCSLRMLQELGQEVRSIILVNSPYTQRRGWAVFKKHIPDRVYVYRVNSGTGDQFRPENWYKQEDTLRVVLNEFFKMRASVVYNTA